MRNKKKIWMAVVILVLAATACTNQDRAELEAVQNAYNADYYIPVNDIERLNYNRRQQIADDPNTILWCTFFPATLGQEPFTFPVVGKLTSSNKRPWDGDPGPDNMYGSSSEYRYGFSPAGIYADFTGLSSFCTTEPTTFQLNETRVVVEYDSQAMLVTQLAREALASGDAEHASELLQQFENGGE